MFLARVKKKVVSAQKHSAYQAKTVFIVQPVHPDGEEVGDECVAMDYVGAGVGNIVVCGGAPGVSKIVFNLESAPIRTLIMAIVDEVKYNDIFEDN